MSVFRFTFENGEGPDFIVDVTTTGTGSNLVIQNTPATNITCRDVNLTSLSSFTPGNNNSPIAGNTVGIPYWEFQEYVSVPPGAGDPKYWSWRSANTVLSHPTSGKSFDLWFADPLYRRIVQDGNVWSTLTGAARALNPNYWTVFYDYDGQYAVGWKK
ncbi:MAG: hypothetical protein ACO25K_08000 [Candidatus Fonsibacter ubiquis]